MRVLVVAALIGLAACAPHEREESLLFSAPAFATARTQRGTVVTCEASLRSMSLMLFHNDRKKTLDAFAREFVVLLETNGYVGARDLDWEAPSEVIRRGTVAIPPLQGQPAVELFVQIQRRHAVVTTLVYEALPEDFGRLLPTIQASADSLLVAPPRD